VGLLAAAQGRRRTDPIEDLLQLEIGVRTDQAGSLLRDYHTVSTVDGKPLPQAAVTSKGIQKPTSPHMYTKITKRYYLQDALFVAAISGDPELLHGLHGALRTPAFPLALGRRCCPPTQPLVLPSIHNNPGRLWDGSPLQVLSGVPWQVPIWRLSSATLHPAPQHGVVQLQVTVDDQQGNDTAVDLPLSFHPKQRQFTSRPVTHHWVLITVDVDATAATPDRHDPMYLLEG